MSAPNRPSSIIAVVTAQEKHAILNDIARLNAQVPVGQRRYTMSTYIRMKLGLPPRKPRGSEEN